MSKKSLAALPEVFVSDGKISKAVYQAVEGAVSLPATRLWQAQLSPDTLIVRP